jgi:hypothetical protein
LKKRLSVLLALIMMFCATVAGPASASPDGNNGNHCGDIAHEDNGMHIGVGAGLGKFQNLGLFPERRGLR